MKLTPEQIAGYVQVAGSQWQNPQAMAIAVAIAMGESGGETEAVNRANTNGSTDYGLFQINSVHKSILDAGNWKDPDSNAKMAYKIYLAQGFKAWTVYKTGKYMQHMPRAIQASRNPAKVGTQTPPDPGTPLNPPNAMIPTGLDSILGFFKMISDPKTWMRVGYFIGGILLLGIAIIALVRKTSVGQMAGKAVKAFVTKKVPV